MAEQKIKLPNLTYSILIICSYFLLNIGFSFIIIYTLIESRIYFNI